MFAAALKEAGAAATVKLYQGKTHTDPIIEVSHPPGSKASFRVAQAGTTGICNRGSLSLTTSRCTVI